MLPRGTIPEHLKFAFDSTIIAIAVALPFSVFGCNGFFRAEDDDLPAAAASIDREGWSKVPAISMAAALPVAMVPYTPEDAAPEPVEPPAAVPAVPSAKPVTSKPAAAKPVAAPAVADPSGEGTAEASPVEVIHRTPADSSSASPPAPKRKRCANPEPDDPRIKLMPNGAYSIDRELVNSYANHPGRLDDIAWVDVHTTAGDKDGFVIGGMNCHNVLQQAGLKNGDVITSVDGHRVTSIAGAIRTWFQLKGDDRIVLDVVRKGEPITLVYRLRD